ncbi:MAG: hypothetical protein LBV04_00300 [Deferribacteraceae bacterium]|jgi:hypothetical protein|nr:hypothetical protein [Deferribacteraceae bacterium]
MAKIGLIDRYIGEVTTYTYQIDLGRKNFQIEEGKGRILFNGGIAKGLKLSKEIQAAELVFLNQELEFCDKLDKFAISSLQAAISSLNGAMRSLSAVESGNYHIAEMTYLNNTKNRMHDMPIDGFHQACNAHYTRLQNSLRTPGMNLDEKNLCQLRAENMKAAVKVYIELQKAAIGSINADRA